MKSLLTLTTPLIGYKQWKHIAKALQAHSQAIHTALGNYNTATRLLKKQELKWDDVVEYAFLAEFDLLCDSREDVRNYCLHLV